MPGIQPLVLLAQIENLETRTAAAWHEMKIPINIQKVSTVDRGVLKILHHFYCLQ